nr:fibrillin-1-like [Lytechinus pictus]
MDYHWQSYTGNWQLVRRTTISAPRYVSGYQTSRQNGGSQNPTNTGGSRTVVHTTGQIPSRTSIHTTGQVIRQNIGRGSVQTSALNSPRTGVISYQQILSRQNPSSSSSYSCRSRGCDYRCQVGSNGQVQCICPPGYRLGTDQRSCVDVDECSRYSGLCQQGCQNTLGGYRCICSSGMLTANRRTCSGGCQSCNSNVRPNPRPNPQPNPQPNPRPYPFPNTNTNSNLNPNPNPGSSCPPGFVQRRTADGIQCVDEKSHD